MCKRGDNLGWFRVRIGLGRVGIQYLDSRAQRSETISELDMMGKFVTMLVDSDEATLLYLYLYPSLYRIAEICCPWGS